MRRTLSAALLGVSSTAAVLALSASPAVAAKACAGRSYSNHPAQESAFAFCGPGTQGSIRVKIVCMRETNYTTYTRYGPWIYDTGESLSEAKCNGVDALVSHTYQLR
jgi:hypothetical protein